MKDIKPIRVSTNDEFDGISDDDYRRSKESCICEYNQCRQ